jgi:hypothetical protein
MEYVMAERDKGTTEEQASAICSCLGLAQPQSADPRTIKEVSDHSPHGATKRITRARFKKESNQMTDLGTFNPLNPTP